MTGAGTLNIIVALLFILGIIGIYLPQYYKIYTKKSSYGLSNTFMILGNSATLLSSINSLIYYINAFPCSSKQKCAQEFMGLAIIILQWILFLINYVMFVRYHPSSRDKEGMSWKVGWGFIVSNVFGVCCLAITVGFLVKDQWHYETSETSFGVWSDILEVLITCLFLLHYIPQIWETNRLKDIGSISLVSLGIMCPGSFIWTIFLASQSKITSNPNASQPQVWIPYLIVGIMQLVLLIMGIYYERMNKKRYDYLLQINDDLDIPIEE
jgi:uncharacterized protein with PQ loop repeat